MERIYAYIDDANGDIDRAMNWATINCDLFSEQAWMDAYANWVDNNIQEDHAEVELIVGSDTLYTIFPNNR